jgi:hypothetical protein
MPPRADPWHDERTMWDELWIEKEVAAGELAAAVAKAHGAEPSDVVIVDGIASEPSRQARIQVVRTRGGGQFAMRIQLEGAVPADRRVFCARLASALTCKVLGDDGNINPFSFMLYEPGNATRVSVDPQKLEQHAPVVTGPYDAVTEEDSHPTRPIRRYPLPTEHRASRGGQVAHIVNEYMVEGLPRPPMLAWSPDSTETYETLTKLLGTIAFRKASDDELASIKTWSDKLRTAFTDPEKAGWFVIEVLEASTIVLAEPWDPDLPAINITPA